MKKNFTTFFIAMMLVVLSGCGEDIEVPNNSNDDKIDPTAETMTVFSSSSNGTRTSMDTNAKFYWEAGDYIWVDTLKNGSFTGKSHSIELSDPTQAPSAKFYFRQIVLTEPKYDLTYTGNNSSKGTEVTIAAEQTQSGWNSPAHLGESGDCGVAEATRDNSTGTYSFSLKHKASYLIFQPYRVAAISDGWKLKSIEITSDNTIAGTYPFNKTDGIVTTSTITNPSNTIKLTCDGNSDFTLPQSAASDDKSCYMVIQPGTHKLTIRYEIQPTGSVNGVAGATFYITKEVETTFKVNGVKKIRHELNVEEFSPEYYNWDAPLGATYVANSYNGNTAWMPTQASRSCKDMPNPNEVYWYVFNGDCRWDGVTPWRFSSSSARIYIGGAWFKKQAAILADNTLTKCSHSSHGGNGPTFCSQHGPNGIDLCNTPNDTPSNVRYYPSSLDTYLNGGRPNNISDYFYLPAAGIYLYDRMPGNLSHAGEACWYWTTAPASNTNGSSAQTIFISNESVFVSNGSDRRNGIIGGYRTDGTNWFQ